MQSPTIGERLAKTLLEQLEALKAVNTQLREERFNTIIESLKKEEGGGFRKETHDNEHKRWRARELYLASLPLNQKNRNLQSLFNLLNYLKTCPPFLELLKAWLQTMQSQQELRGDTVKRWYDLITITANALMESEGFKETDAMPPTFKMLINLFQKRGIQADLLNAIANIDLHMRHVILGELSVEETLKQLNGVREYLNGLENGLEKDKIIENFATMWKIDWNDGGINFNQPGTKNVEQSINAISDLLKSSSAIEESDLKTIWTSGFTADQLQSIGIREELKTEAYRLLPTLHVFCRQEADVCITAINENHEIIENYLELAKKNKDKLITHFPALLDAFIHNPPMLSTDQQNNFSECLAATVTIASMGLESAKEVPLGGLVFAEPKWREVLLNLHRKLGPEEFRNKVEFKFYQKNGFSNFLPKLSLEALQMIADPQDMPDITSSQAKQTAASSLFSTSTDNNQVTPRKQKKSSTNEDDEEKELKANHR